MVGFWSENVFGLVFLDGLGLKMLFMVFVYFLCGCFQWLLTSRKQYYIGVDNFLCFVMGWMLSGGWFCDGSSFEQELICIWWLLIRW